MSKESMKETLQKALKREGFDSIEDFKQVCKGNKTNKKAFFSKELEESMTEIDIPECTDFDFSFIDEGEDNV